MAGGKAKKRKITPFKPYEAKTPDQEKYYFRISQSLYESDAFRDMTPTALRLYLDLVARARGHEEIIYSWEMARERCGMSKQSFTQAKRHLTKLGLVYLQRRGCYQASRFRFSEEWKNYVSDKRDAFTGEYPGSKAIYKRG